MSESTTLTDSSMPTVHPWLAEYPRMSAEQLELRAAHIKEYGQQIPGVTYNGQLVAGRDDVKACEIAGVPFRTIEYEGNNVLAFITASNFHPDCSTAQRAAVGAKLFNRKPGRESATSPKCEFTRAQIAKLVGVSTRTLDRAIALKKRPDLLEQVCRGEMTLDEAEEEMKPAPDSDRNATPGDRTPAVAALMGQWRMTGKLVASLKTPSAGANKQELADSLRAQSDHLRNAMLAVADELASAKPEPEPDDELTENQLREHLHDHCGASKRMSSRFLNWLLANNNMPNMPADSRTFNRHKYTAHYEEFERDEKAKAAAQRKAKAATSTSPAPETTPPTDQSPETTPDPEPEADDDAANKLKEWEECPTNQPAPDSSGGGVRDQTAELKALDQLGDVATTALAATDEHIAAIT